jgi:hypothetical protein
LPFALCFSRPPLQANNLTIQKPSVASLEH